MNNCIFCKIINNEIPSYTLYEDEMVKVFLDINPERPGHTLIIPKTHFVDINEAIEIVSKYDLLSIPVVDDNDVLIGSVNTHDLIDEFLYPMWKKKNKF